MECKCHKRGYSNSPGKVDQRSRMVKKLVTLKSRMGSYYQKKVTLTVKKLKTMESYSLERGYS